MENEKSDYKKPEILKEEGTLAIDLGNSTTVVAFQGEQDKRIRLLNLPPISRSPGEIPTVVWYSDQTSPYKAIGDEISQLNLSGNYEKNFHSDFKRWICAPEQYKLKESLLSPQRAGEILIRAIWDHLPKNLVIKRLVLTAPVETYREYRSWLINVCNQLEVNEIALVDEPTAAAMGAGLNSGSKLLVVDIGGSTIDMSLVALEGGEGKAEPVAQLLRFGGENLEGKSNQAFRCAKVLGKAGQRIGGRDIDRWIAKYSCPESVITEDLLNASEKLKCKLSATDLKDSRVLSERVQNQINNDINEIQLSKSSLEELLKERGLLKILKTLFDHTISSAKVNGCNLEDLDYVVLVGGGSRIPLIQAWLENECNPTQLLKPPSIEAVAIGALYLTPGVTIRDVLQKGISLRCWDPKNQTHKWHPLFLAGQPWPTSKPLEIILSTSKEDQNEIELKIGEPDFENVNEVIYIDGIPTINSNTIKTNIKTSITSKTTIKLTQAGQIGEDCLKLNFNLDDNCNLTVQGFDLRNNQEILTRIIGSVR